MQYDPIKKTLGRFFNRNPLTLRLFYRMLDILLLRTWHVHRALRSFARNNRNKKEVHVLDAGSGFGQYSWYMARKNPRWHITGIDVKEEEVEACNAFFNKTGKQNARFFRGDLRQYVQPESFDLILSVDVMEHIEEDETVFGNFYRSLKPGGMLLINTPSDLGGSDVDNEHDASFIEEHVRDGYSIYEIRDKLARAGFYLTETNYTYGRPGNIAWRISIKFPMMLLNRSKAFLIILPLYYLLTMPLVLLLNLADLHGEHTKGTGLMVQSWKKT